MHCSTCGKLIDLPLKDRFEIGYCNNCNIFIHYDNEEMNIVSIHSTIETAKKERESFICHLKNQLELKGRNDVRYDAHICKIMVKCGCCGKMYERTNPNRCIEQFSFYANWDNDNSLTYQGCGECRDLIVNYIDSIKGV